MASASSPTLARRAAPRIDTLAVAAAPLGICAILGTARLLTCKYR